VASLKVHIDDHLLTRQAILQQVAEEEGIADDADSVVSDFYGGGHAQAERERILSLLDSRAIGSHRVATFLLLDAEFGAVVLSTDPSQTEGYILINETQLVDARNESMVIHLPNLPWNAKPTLLLTQPIVDTGGWTVALLCCPLYDSELDGLVVIQEDLGESGGAYLVGPDMRLLSETPDGEVSGSLSLSKGAEKALTGMSGFHIVSNSEPEYEAYEYLEIWGIALIVEMDQAEAEAGLEVVRVRALAAGAIFAGALIVISVVLSKGLVRDLSSLVSWSKDVGNGQWDTPLELGSSDEFQELEGAFQRMVRDMVKHQSQLRMAERRFSNLYINSLDPVYIARADGTIVEMNPAGERVLGLPKNKDGTYGYSLEELFAEEEDRKEFIGRLDREGAVAGFEARFLLPSGRELFVLVSATRRVGDEGRVRSYQGVIHDITDRKRFEEALVEAKNEAEFYCDIMSHDLNNAVQGLGGYLELCNLANDLDDVNKFLPYAHEQMARASDLLRNVRRMSHLGSQQVDLKEIDLHKSLIKAVWAVERAHAHETIDVRFDLEEEGPVILGEAFIDDVFINLLDNAVKYDTHDNKVVELKVTKAEVDGTDRWRVRVADRGPGVADRDKQTIFGRFERRALKEYGTGLGLSIVVKAVERSGGRTWVEDRVKGDHSQGAAFVVELLAV
jgi:PAS domain S-box-containing protein